MELVPAVGVTVIGLSDVLALLTVTASTAKSFTFAVSTATCTPVAEAFVVTRLPSPATLKDASPSFRYLRPVDPVSPVKPIPLVVAFTVLLSRPTTRLPLFVPTKSVLIPLAPITLSGLSLSLTVPVLEFVSNFNVTSDTAFLTSVMLAALVPTLPPLETFVICWPPASIPLAPNLAVLVPAFEVKPSLVIVTLLPFVGEPICKVVLLNTLSPAVKDCPLKVLPVTAPVVPSRVI